MPTLTETPTTVFTPPPDAFAPAPPEARAGRRDAIRMLVAGPTSIAHARFADLPHYLRPGDVVVVNNSATIAGEIDAEGPHGSAVLHLATALDDGSWVLEVRTAPDARRSVLDAAAGQRFVSGRLVLTLLEPYPYPDSSPTGIGNRLWRAAASGDVRAHLTAAGRPIAYGYLDQR